MNNSPIVIALLLGLAAPAVPAESFPAYRPNEDTAPADWRALNERMRALGGHRGHVQAEQVDNRAPAQAADAPHVHGSTASPAPAAPAAAGPPSTSGGRPMHGHGHQPMRGHMHPQKERP